MKKCNRLQLITIIPSLFLGHLAKAVEALVIKINLVGMVPFQKQTWDNRNQL
jgi:hypothetical protein